MTLQELQDHIQGVINESKGTSHEVGLDSNVMFSFGDLRGNRLMAMAKIGTAEHGSHENAHEGDPKNKQIIYFEFTPNDLVNVKSLVNDLMDGSIDIEGIIEIISSKA